MPVPGKRLSLKSAEPRPGFGSDAANVPWADAARFAHRQAIRLLDGRNPGLAEDIAQTSLLKLFQNATRIRTDWRGLLSRIVLNTARSKIKAERSRRARVATNMAATESAPCCSAPPSAPLLAEEAAAALASSLAKLDAAFGSGTRAIVDFRAQGVSWEEIAGIMKLADRTCRYRHEKALAYLVERLSIYDEREGQND